MTQGQTNFLKIFMACVVGGLIGYYVLPTLLNDPGAGRMKLGKATKVPGKNGPVE